MCVCVRAHEAPSIIKAPRLPLHLIWELVKRDSCWCLPSQPQGLVAPNNILESGRHQEVLLLQPELFALYHLEREGGREEKRREGGRRGRGLCIPFILLQSRSLS